MKELISRRANVVQPRGPRRTQHKQLARSAASPSPLPPSVAAISWQSSPWRKLMHQDFVTLFVLVLAAFSLVVYGAMGLGYVQQFEVSSMYNDPQVQVATPSDMNGFVQVPDIAVQNFFMSSLGQGNNPLDWSKHYGALTDSYAVVIEPHTLPEGWCRISQAPAAGVIRGVCNVNTTHARGLSQMIVANAEKMNNANNAGTYATLVTGVKTRLHNDWVMVSAVISGSSDPVALNFMHSWDPNQPAGDVGHIQIWGGDGLRIDVCPPNPPAETLCTIAKNYYELNNFPFDPRSVPLVTTEANGQLIAVPIIVDAAKYDRIISIKQSTDYAQVVGIQNGVGVAAVLTIEVRPISGGQSNTIPMVQVVFFCAIVVWAESQPADELHFQSRICLFFVYGQLASVTIISLQLAYFTYYEVFYTAINLEVFGTNGRISSVLLAQLASICVTLQVMTPMLKHMGSPTAAVTRFSPIHLLGGAFPSVLVVCLLIIASRMDTIDKDGIRLERTGMCASKTHLCGQGTLSIIHYALIGYCVLAMFVGRRCCRPSVRSNNVTGTQAMLMTADRSRVSSCPMLVGVENLQVHRDGLTAFESFCLGTLSPELVTDVSIHRVYIDGKPYITPHVSYSAGFQMIAQLGMVRTKDVYLIVLARMLPLNALRHLNWSIWYYPVVGNTVYPGHRAMLDTLKEHNLSLAIVSNPLLS